MAEIVAPEGRLRATFHPVIGELPAVTFTLATNPPFHALVTEYAAEQVRPPGGGVDAGVELGGVDVGGTEVGGVELGGAPSLTVMLELPLLWYPSVARIW